MSTTTDTEVQDYLDQLRHELADLPADEVNEIVQDLAPQLAEIAGELGADLSATALADRLGTPADYAREIRSAAGLGESVGRPPSAWLPRTVLWALVAGTVAAGYGGYLSGWDVSSEEIAVAGFTLPFFGLALVLSGIAVAGAGLR